MVSFAILVATITLGFTVLIYLQYQVRRRPHQRLWALSMLLAADASLAYVMSYTLDNHALLFKVYYILGALLVAPCLGLGSLYLSAPPRVAGLAARVVAVLGVLGAAGILLAPVDARVLAEQMAAGASGKGVLGGKGLWLGPMVALNIFGTVGVVGPAILSAVRLLGRRTAPGPAQGLILIALGVMILAAAGAATWLGTNSFWATMAIGYGVVFAGFLRTGRDDRPAGRSPGAPVAR